MDTPRTRLEVALQEVEPSGAVYKLACALRDEGMTQPELYQLFDEFRAIHENDADETLCDALLDTMDYISGWCSKGRGLYEV